MPKRRETPRCEQSIRLLNSAPKPLTLILEPWAERYVVAPGAAVELVAQGPKDGRLEVNLEADRVVYGWTGSTVDVIQDGEALSPAMPARPTTEGDDARPNWLDLAGTAPYPALGEEAQA